MRLSVLFILVLGATQASEALAGEGQTYEVRPRDRLERVAEHFGTTVGEIISANPPRSFIRECIGRRELTLRNGETITICRRVHYGLIAGRTLVIPVPRLIVESENVRLGAANTALEAERDQAQRERDSLKQERDALRAERDELKQANEAVLRAKAELQGRYDELKQAGIPNPSSGGRETAGDSGQTPPATYSREGFLAVIVMFLCGALFIGALALYRYLDIRSKKVVPEPTEEMRKAKEELERIRQELEDLDATRRSLVKEGQDLVERRRQLEADEQKIGEARIALDRERESLRNQRDELGRWEENLAVREAAPAPEKPKTVTVIGVPPIFPHVPTGAEKTKTEAGLLQVVVARGRQLLEEDFRTLAGREAACKAREDAAARRAEELGAEEGRLLRLDKELCDKARGLEELHRSLNSQKAKQDRKEFEQGQREENLVQGFADLKTQQERAQRELDAKRPELDRRASEIDAKIRMYDEDIAPAIKKAREDLAVREAALAEDKANATRRAEKLSEDERAYEHRLRELNDAVGALDERAERLGEGERKLSEEQLELRNNREAFANEVDAAKSTLTRAKKKKALVEAIDAREAAIARREGECDTREGALEAWEERLTAREGLPRARGPHRPTLSPPPLALPAVEFPPGASAGDDDNPTVTFRAPPGEEIDPRAATHIEMQPGPATPVDSVDIEGERFLGASPPEEPPSTVTPAEAEQSAHETGPHIPVAEQPTPHSESSFWCVLCKRDVPMDDMETHNKLHQEQEKPGPLGQG